MIAVTSASTKRTASFGSFRLLLEERALFEGDAPVRLGGRALAILVLLVERAGDLVTKEEIAEKFWPNATVEDGTLRVHMAALRKALGDGQAGHRYIATDPGRGYRFVALTRVVHISDSVRGNLPAPVATMIGRTGFVEAVGTALRTSRLTTIAGPGGMGKTTVALAVAHQCRDEFEDGVWFVDFSQLADPTLLPSVLATSLGLVACTERPIASLAARLRDRRLLIVFDNCEHVVGAAASVAEELLRATTRAYILATSREPLRAEGERVFRLPSLDSPPPSDGLTATEALTFPAVQLFAERAAACFDGFVLSDADAPIVAEICRRSDGIPLAIELAAERGNAFGNREIQPALDDRCALPTRDTPTTSPRHETLRATLDWSYALLRDSERVVLRRLGILVDWFTIDSARSVAPEALGWGDFMDVIADLAAKSLLLAEVNGAVARYRLLDTTRAYALEKLAEADEIWSFDPSNRGRFSGSSTKA